MREPARPAAKRLTPGTVHRDAVLATLPPEQMPVAEQVLRGGIPAVRQAIAVENEKAAAEGRSAIAPEALMAMAEQLLPRLKTAMWRDRAEAAVAVADEIAIRDLRSVVAGAEGAARDDDTRMLAKGLRDALERRLEEQRMGWVQEIITNLDEGRVVRALRLSSRPPDPGVRFPAELAVKLAEASGAALSPDTSPDRWVALLEAVGMSPVRRNVHPAGLPPDPPDELMAAARHAAGRIPALAPLLGLPMPPPPGPARPVRPPRPTSGRPPRPPRPASQTPTVNREPRIGTAPAPSAPSVGAEAPPVDHGPIAHDAEVGHDEPSPGETPVTDEAPTTDDAPVARDPSPIDEVPAVDEAQPSGQAPLFDQIQPSGQAPLFEQAAPSEQAPLFDQVPPPDEAPPAV